MRKTLKNLAFYFIGPINYKLQPHIRLFNWAKEKKLPILTKLICYRIQRVTGLTISPNTTLPNSTKFPHPTGIVIGDGVTIEENVTIYQNVTIGAARIGEAKEKKYPFIAENSTIFAGAKIFGEIRIGKNSIIGANAVITKNVPDDSVAAGIPAKIWKKFK